MRSPASCTSRGGVTTSSKRVEPMRFAMAFASGTMEHANAWTLGRPPAELVAGLATEEHARALVPPTGVAFVRRVPGRSLWLWTHSPTTPSRLSFDRRPASLAGD